MHPGLLVVLAVIGALLLVPLWLVWLSRNSRRWAGLERALGKQDATGKAAGWLWKVYAALVLLPAAIGLLSFGRLRNPMLGWLAVGQAVLWGVTAAAWFSESRRRSGREGGGGPARPRVEGRAERSGPDAGVGGKH